MHDDNSQHLLAVNYLQSFNLPFICEDIIIWTRLNEVMEDAHSLEQGV